MPLKVPDISTVDMNAESRLIGSIVDLMDARFSEHSHMALLVRALIHFFELGELGV